MNRGEDALKTSKSSPLASFLRVASRMPLATTAWLARYLGNLWYRLDSRHREVVLRNLELAYGAELGKPQREQICRGVFEHFSRVILEFPYLSTLSRQNLADFVSFSGVEHMEAAFQRNKGVLVMASHFGNWELMSLAFSLHLHPSHVVVRPLDNRLLDDLANEMRSRGGNQLIQKKGAVRQILRALKRGQIVALLVDQNVDWYDGVFSPFFIEIACTNKALAVLALRTGAPVVPIYNVRQEDGRYITYFEPEVPLIRTGDMTRDVEENTARFNRIIEGYIRLHPEHWLWLHMRWKTRPYQLWPRESLKKQRWLVIRPQVQSSV